MCFRQSLAFRKLTFDGVCVLPEVEKRPSIPQEYLSWLEFTETFLTRLILEDWIFRLSHKGLSLHLYFLLVQKLASVVVVIIFQSQRLWVLGCRFSWECKCPTSIVLLVCLLGLLWNFGSGRDLFFSKKWLILWALQKGLGRNCLYSKDSCSLSNLSVSIEHRNFTC